MAVLVTGSSGHLGEAVMRLLRAEGRDAIGFDLVPGPVTDLTGTITDPERVARAVKRADTVIHAATLHKPHVATHARQAFVDTNVTGTLTLLEAAVSAGVEAFVFTSTTSAFGAALTRAPGEPAGWIDETVASMPRNIYGVTKTAAEDLCQLMHRLHGLPCLVLRTSRFFPEADDSREIRDGFADENAKANEFLYRRVDIEDAARAHLLALAAAPRIGFARYVVSATTPFCRDDRAALGRDAAAVLHDRVPQVEAVYRTRGYRMFPRLDRIYDNAKARRELGWTPEYDFARVLGQLGHGEPIGSPLARSIGIKGYHGDAYADGLYPVA